MKILIASFILFIAYSAISAAEQALTKSNPDYCVGFSTEACARMKTVVDAGLRPKYCVPGFGRTDSGLKLSPEQLRICYVLAAAPAAQVVEDARAMVRENWATSTALIQSIETGYKCEVVDELSASVAIRRVQMSMQDDLIQAGLINDPTLNIEKFTSAAVQAGKTAAEKGACARMTPSWRARLRTTVSALMQ